MSTDLGFSFQSLGFGPATRPLPPVGFAEPHGLGLGFRVFE